MKTIQIKDADVENLKKMAKTFFDIYGDENDEDRKWSFQDVEDMRSIGQEFIELVMSYLNQSQDA
jgi:NACalpha-BTF3-like transcription factor